MKKALKIFLIIVLVVIACVAGFFLFMLQPWLVIFPHERIIMTLPFPPEVDSFTSLIPMGEKIEHNESNGNPDGHPGIDFGWSKEVDIIAVADGRIMSVTRDKYGKYNVNEAMGAYRAEYKELNSLDPKIKFGVKVKKGQVIGQTGHLFTGDKKESDPSGQMHWDFGSSSMLIDRLCPVTYFDQESQERIQKIWENVPSTSQFKIPYPDICNGVFKDKVD